MKKLIYLFVGALTIFACQKNEPDDLFGKSPSKRFEENQSELRNALTSASQGWKLTYFTKEGTFGGYHFLMKFTPEGLVTMVSDFNSSTISPTTSKYELQQGQGVKLTFTTKTYIHELSDAMQGKRGAGYAGEYQFLYYGKEGDKLKFKTQRKSTEQFVYFEPATAQDWTDISTLSSNLNTLAENISNYYMEVTTNGTTIPYEIDMQNGSIGVAPLSKANDFSQVSVVATKIGVAFKPALTIQGKNFTELIRDDSTTPPIYKATVDGVTVKVYYSLVPPDEFVTDDYLVIPSRLNAFVILPSTLKSLMSRDFYDNILKIDGVKDFEIFRMDFGNDGTCTIQIAYKFDGNNNSWLYLTCNYELRNKRLYLKNPGALKKTNATVWEKTENATIFAKATNAITKTIQIAAEGFYVANTGRTYSGYPIYSLQSRNNPTYIAPYLVYKR
ncbi:Uncharacterised protein [Capnocytophaga ochracea]|uniref:DUF4302 domain-containing protein n=1 Tax=Capnocytophaga ochracea TaxID=1018 RepID=A0A2X2RJ03_CAPOC|nr:DUF4302 domain-containing protein [Capnocytophaga ochracea]SQA78357.1 Uncharacterised protein [Capnocytophaga ochracea]